jgi:hypothetical protein
MAQTWAPGTTEPALSTTRPGTSFAPGWAAAGWVGGPPAGTIDPSTTAETKAALTVVTAVTIRESLVSNIILRTLFAKVATDTAIVPAAPLPDR